MRRRRVRTVREEESPTLLLMAAGAVAGAAAGLYLGRRYRSFDAFLADMRSRFGDLQQLWNDDELAASERGARLAEVVDEFDDEEDDEFEGVDEDELEDEDESFETSADDEAESPLEDDEDESVDEDVLDDDDILADDEDELDDDLVAATRENGSSDSALRAETDARRLERRLLRALQEEPVLSERAIEIAVVGDGVVELTGSVHAIEEVSRAAALARNVAGVNMVLNRIDVRSGGSMDTASVPREPVKAPARNDRSAPGG